MKNYLQIGSASGNDYFYHRIKELNPLEIKLYLVEPIQSNRTEEFYKNTNFSYNIIRDAVVPNTYKDDNIAFYLFGNDANLSSVLHRMVINPTSSVFIKALKIHDLLDSIKSDIELLCVDAEGLDVEIINSIDLEKYNIKEIFFEYWSFEDDKELLFKAGDLYPILHDKLLSHKYKLIETVDTDGNTNFRYCK